MTILTTLTCYRLHVNGSSSAAWERYPRYDLETTEDDVAVIHMAECASKERGLERFVFRVESGEICDGEVPADLEREGSQ